MIFRFLCKNRQTLFFSVLLLGFLLCRSVSAMPLGTLLYRTSGDGNLYGYNTDELVVIKKGVIKNIYTGHVGIYIGKEDGVDYVVEALPSGVVKVPAKNFINTKNGEELIGAKIPKNLSEIQRMKVVQLAKKLADSNLAYDFDFKKQKGAKSGEWICVGLTEKIYESANILNPLDVSSLEYDPRFYAINITPDGFDNYSVQNKKNGDCLSKDFEFSKISANRQSLIPAPEIIGFNAGYEYEGERYFFFPLTQFWQNNLEDVEVDIELSSDFDDKEIRGKVPELAMIFKWSLINNPISSLNKIVNKIASIFKKENSGLVFTDKDLENDSGKNIENNFEAEEEIKSTSDSVYIDSSTNSLSKKDSTTLSEKLQSLISIDSSQAKLNKTEAPLLGINSSASDLELNKALNEDDLIEKELFVASVEKFDELKKNLLISMVYATLSDDYVEIYNPSDTAIDLEEAGIRLYRTKTSATPSIMIRIGNLNDGTYPGGTIIPAKGKYLIARSSASSEIKNKAQAISSRSEFSFTGKGYTVYLSGGVVSSDDDEDIIDKVGFSESKYYERFPAVEILDNHLLVRKAKSNSSAFSMKEGSADFGLGNSYDSGNNLFDFVLLNLGGIENQNNNQTENNNSNNTNNANNSNNNTNNANNSTENTDNNSTNNEEQNENQENNQNETLLPLLISKIYTTDKDDYIELYNPNDIDINLEEKSYRLYKTKTGASPYLMLRFGNLSDASYPGGLVIPAKGKYLITRFDASNEILNKAQAIVNRSEFTYTGDAYTIYLSTGVVSGDNDEDIVDKVGYGNATYYRVLPASEILDSHLLIRKAQADSTAILMAEDCEHFSLGNSFNSQNNNFDFVLLDLSKLQGDYCDLNNQNDDNEEDGNNNNEGENNYENDDVYDYNYCLESAISSSNIINLWHFDECQGALAYDFAGDNNVFNLSAARTEGLFSCAISHHQDDTAINFELNPLFDSNNFTLLFNYKLLYNNSRPNIKFFNSINNSYFQLQFYGSYSQFWGFPNVDYRLDSLKWPKGDSWHQLALVVNKNLDYWALYNDGEEVLKKNIGLHYFPDIDRLSLIATGNDTVFDELVLFKKALSKQEILANKQKNLPFNSGDCQNKRFKKPELISYFNFDDNYFKEMENNKTVIYDLSEHNESGELIIDNDSLFLEGGNFYLNVESNQELLISSVLPKLEEKSDISLSFWIKRNWEDESLGLLNYFYLKIISQSNNIFGLSLSDNLSYYFNGIDFQIDKDLLTLGLNDDNWHNVVLVYDYYKFELRLYVDGNLKETIDKDWLDYNFLEKIILSSTNGNAYLDEISLWSGVISDFDANDIYLSKKGLFE